MKTLIIGPAWVGDMVMAQALFRVLKQRDADEIIDVLAPDWTRPLLDRMPEVRRAVSMPLSHGQLQLKKRFKIGRALHAEKYDRAIVLPNSFKSALVPLFAGISKRIGFRGEYRYGLLNDVRILDKEKLPLMVERFVSLGLDRDEDFEPHYPLPHLIANQKQIESILEKQKLSRNKKIIAFCPGAEFGPAKCWLPEYFSEVANHYLNKGWQVWLFGSQKDFETAKIINTITKERCVNLAGKTALAEAIDLLSLASLVVTNDSGLMHVACALARPVVALFGSSSPAFTPPLGEKVKVLSLNLECSPCFKRVCPLGHFNCMKQLKPQRVLQALDELQQEGLV